MSEDIEIKNDYLVYMKKVGSDYSGEYSYELLFSNKPEDVDSFDWGESPITQNCTPPSKSLLTQMLTIKTNRELTVVTDDCFENSYLYNFIYYDVCDGIISLAWENEIGDENDYKLVFRYGDRLFDVLNSLDSFKITYDRIRIN